MKLTADIREIPFKKALLTFITLLAVGGLAYGGWATYKKITNRPLTPEETKRLIASYLKDKSGRSEFKSSIDISKEKNPWLALKFVYDAPPDYKTIYRGIGEHLSVAENLLNSSEEKERMSGLRILLELLDVANDIAYDAWLGARIVDAYLIPSFDKVEDNPKRGYSHEQLMHQAGRAYRNAEEDDKLIDLGKMYLAKFGSSPRADDVRRRLINMLQSKGRKKEAEAYQSQGKSPEAAQKTGRRGSQIPQDGKPATNP